MGRAEFHLLRDPFIRRHYEGIFMVGDDRLGNRIALH